MDKVRPKFIFNLQRIINEPFYFKTTQTHITDLCDEIIFKNFYI